MAFPDVFSKREKYLRKKGLLLQDFFELEFEVGNHYQQIEKNYRVTKNGYHMNNQFTAFVRLKAGTEFQISDIVDKVHFKKHPTFRNHEEPHEVKSMNPNSND